MNVIKEIWCMPHSHLDIGYTHPQPLLMELQADYLTEALELTEQTKHYPEEAQFRWTVEANYVMKKWLEIADKEQTKRMKQAVKEGRICITAMQMHTTPGCDARALTAMLSELKELEDVFSIKIKSAVNHDVNGQPWPLGQLLLDSGIDFYLTGMNNHYGGAPLPRPSFFLWEMSDGRTLPTFLGEHYSRFNQFSKSFEHSTKVMHAGLKEHVELLIGKGYPHDFVFLTATNPPYLYDNNCPDLTLPKLIKEYNEEGHEWIVRIVTADMLREKLLPSVKQAPVHRGDWSDYWNFGCASTARETRVSRLAKNTLYASEMLACFTNNSTKRLQGIKNKCLENLLIYNEHTWGASQSVSEPEDAETYAQRIHKSKTAYEAADLSAYLLGTQLEALCQNPYQSGPLEGITLVNTSAREQTVEVKYPEKYQLEKGQLAALRYKEAVSYAVQKDVKKSGGIYTLAPFAVQTLSFDSLEKNQIKSSPYAGTYAFCDFVLETPYYTVWVNQHGRITQLYAKKENAFLLDETKGYSLFEPVRESVADGEGRLALFGKGEENPHEDVSRWNHDWKRKLEKQEIDKWETKEQDYSFSFITYGHCYGIRELRQKITFYTYQARIRIETDLFKEAVWEPESLYFAVPLKMSSGWQSHYDTAGEVVCFDQDQLGTSCRDYVTADSAVSMWGEEYCINMACPDAPMVQAGDFSFGKENKKIERSENPLLLAWPLNNYWSTNFMANQSGQMTFAYELNVHRQFSQVNMQEDGIYAKKAVLLAGTLHAEEKKACFLSLEGDVNVLNVYQSRESGKINLILKNNDKEQQILHIKSGMVHVTGAELITPQEDVLSHLLVKEGAVEVHMEAGTEKILRIMTGER